jgi:Fe-S-cluster containining protein
MIAEPQPDHEPPAGFDTANVHLWLLGAERRFAVQVPLGRRRPMELLPPAREFTHQATAAAVRKAQEQGRTISCKAHCGACCRQLVAISVVEAQALAEMVDALPQDRKRELRERFAAVILRLEGAGLLDPQARGGDRGLIASAAGARKALIQEVSRRYFELQIPCPFLEDESCGIHPDRPLVCREYHVSSPAERCAGLYQSRIEKIEPPLHMSDVLARAAARLAGTKARTIPLILALEWIECQGEQLDQTHDGLGMFQVLLDEIDHENQRSFDKRG